MIDAFWTTTRRGLLSLGVALGLASDADAARKKKGKRKACNKKLGTRRCGKKCVDTLTSKDHCGRCGNRCQGERACDGGQCVCRKQVCLVSVRETDLFSSQITAPPDRPLVAVLQGDDQLVSLADPPETIGEFGTELGEFDFPNDVVAGSDDSLYVADTGNLRIQILRPNSSIEAIAFEAGPRSIAVSASATMYVSDGSQVFRLGANGTIDYTWGPDGTSETFFNWISDVAVGDQGALYVLDEFDDSLYRFTESPPGTLSLDWVIGPGSDPGELNGPLAVAVANDLVFVADYGNQRVQALQAADGSPAFEWQAEDSCCLWDPEGIAIGTDGRIYVTSFDSLFTFELGEP